MYVTPLFELDLARGGFMFFISVDRGNARGDLPCSWLATYRIEASQQLGVVAHGFS